MRGEAARAQSQLNTKASMCRCDWSDSVNIISKMINNLYTELTLAVAFLPYSALLIQSLDVH